MRSNLIKSGGLPLLVLLLCAAVFFFGCDDSIGTAGGKAGGRASISRQAIESHLAEFELNTPGLATKIAMAMREGKKFNGKAKDKDGKYFTLTAWIDNKSQDVFCILFYKDIVCPKCKGTGRMELPDIVDKQITGIALDCPMCKGKGILKHQKFQRCWVLNSAEFTDRRRGQEIKEASSLRNAPPGTEEYVRKLGSTVAQERLEACLWLDKNYVRPGINFRDIMPIMERARYSGPVEDNSLTTKIIGKRIGESENVYQFWAGKGINEEWRRAYWRIYVKNSSGDVVRTEFAPGRPPRRRR